MRQKREDDLAHREREALTWLQRGLAYLSIGLVTLLLGFAAFFWALVNPNQFEPEKKSRVQAFWNTGVERMYFAEMKAQRGSGHLQKTEE
jgi:hypothetical protein